jgi:hypothetical protein
VTIGKLSDEVLLAIFRHYLDASPRLWSRIVHICRKWRRLVFASQRDLHLRLFCTHGTPVLKALNCWPALPIIAQYGGSLGLDQSAPEDEDNIVAALKHTDRVISISLTVTNSLLDRLSAIERPFSELEDLVLLSRYHSMWLTLPSSFGWGTRLRTLHLTRVAFPALPQLLRSSTNLVDLQLHEVRSPGLFSPEALTDALSGMAQLRSLSLHFLPTNHIGVSPTSRERVVLPALTRLEYQGITKYLENFVAGINAPRLVDIEITFFKDAISDLSQLSEFVDRIGIHKSHRQVEILSSEPAISVSFTQLGVPAGIKLQAFFERLSEQLSFLAAVCTHFPIFLYHVDDLRISATRKRRQEDNFYTGQWLNSMNSFTGVKYFHLDRNCPMNVVRALQHAEVRRGAVLPAMHKLYIPQPGQRHAPLTEEVVSLMTSRSLSGHPIAVEYERPELHRAGTILLCATTLLANSLE